MKEYDVLVVGGGAAGLSAALVLLRARRAVVVVDAGAPRNASAAHVHGFLSREGVPPRDLLAAGRAEVSSYGGRLIDDTVIGIEPGFQVRLANAPRLGARRILVATGLRDELPDIPGVRERWGRDLLHCPYCHGYEVRDQPLGVLGGRPRGYPARAADTAVVARRHPVPPHRRPHPRAARTPDSPRHRHRRRHRRAAGGRQRSTARRRAGDGTVIPRTAVFVRPRFVPNAELLTGLGCAVDENGWVVHDPVGRTSVAGVWVAGNAADPRAKVISAAGQGSAAAIALNADLVDEDLKHALADHRAGHAASAPAHPTPST